MVSYRWVKDGTSKKWVLKTRKLTPKALKLLRLFAIFLPTGVSYAPLLNFTYRMFNYSTVPWYNCSTLGRLRVLLHIAQDRGLNFKLSRNYKIF